MQETYQLITTFGNLEYQAIDMLNIDLVVAQWKAQNKPPEVPKMRQAWTAIETGRVITLAMKRYNKEPKYLPADIKKALRKEIEDTLPMVDNPYDKQYIQDKQDYASRVYQVHWQSVINAGVVSNEENERLLSLLFAYDVVRDNNTDEDIRNTDKYKRNTNRFKVYDAIIKVSCITADLVHNCLLALDRVYKGQPFLEVLDRRSEKRDEDIPVDAFRHSMETLFIDANLYEHAKTLPIQERGMLAAMLLSNVNMKNWTMEDAREEAIAKANSGIKKSLVKR